MAFQIHNLCGFRQKHFICQFWCHLLILSFLTFPQLQRQHDFTYKQNAVCRVLYTVCITTNPQRMRFRHSCKKIINAGHHRCLPHSAELLTGKLSTDAADGDFFLTLRVCMLGCHINMPCAFLWYPLTLWLAKLVCMHAVLAWTLVSNLNCSNIKI